MNFNSFDFSIVIIFFQRDSAEGIDGHIGGKAAGVAEGESIHIARGFGCVRGKQSHERAGLMTMRLLTGYALMPGDERADEFAAFPRPCTAQRQQGEISLLKIDACAQGFLKDDERSAVVYFCASRDDVDVVIDGVRQLDGNAAVCVAEREQEAFGFVHRVRTANRKAAAFRSKCDGKRLANPARVRTIRMPPDVEHAGAQAARAERRAFPGRTPSGSSQGAVHRHNWSVGKARRPESHGRACPNRRGAGRLPAARRIM